MSIDNTHHINNPGITIKRVNDNKLLINNKEYIGLDTTNVIVGIGDTPKTTEAEEVYNIKTQIHNNWLLIDLETGKRGWFPGSKLIGLTNKENVVMYKEADIESEQVLLIIDQDTKIWIIEDRGVLENSPDWCFCECAHTNNTRGYIKLEDLSNLLYKDPSVYEQ